MNLIMNHIYWSYFVVNHVTLQDSVVHRWELNSLKNREIDAYN